MSKQSSPNSATDRLAQQWEGERNAIYEGIPLRPIRSTWNETRLLVGDRLNDRKIAEYVRRGFYTEEFRQARRDHREKKYPKSKRTGSFVERDGRMIYSPL